VKHDLYANILITVG